MLVVDDNATNRRILEEMLASWHMKPTAVADAESALDGAARRPTSAGEPFDVVILDGQMPGVDGFMLARRIRTDRRFARMPIVMLTSVGHGEQVDAGAASDVDAYLTKPVKHSDLLDALATLFGVSTRHAPAATEPSSAAAPGRRGALRVLVAEDNPVNRKLVTTLLQKRGHHVEAVANGRAARDHACRRPSTMFDVVLMDLQMPEMSGLEATAGDPRSASAERGGTCRSSR